MINANEFEEMKTIIQKTYYKKVFTEELYIEHDINQYLYSKYIKYFKEEYKEHVTYKQCRSMECKNLIQMEIDANKCKGCGICQRNCPVNAIEGEGREVRKINQEKCIKCGTCLTKCPFAAIR